MVLGFVLVVELSIRVKKLVAKLAKSFGIHTRHTESLGDFRYNLRAIGLAPRRFSTLRSDL